MSGAARVFLTLDDLARLLLLPPGYRAEAAAFAGEGLRPGIFVTVSGVALPPVGHSTMPLPAMGLAEFSALLEDHPVSKAIPYEDLVAAGCVTPNGRIDWHKWESLQRAKHGAAHQNEPPPPPPSVPPGMPRPVTKSDPPEAGYTPRRPPVAPNASEVWPLFPGEGMNYRGAPDSDTGDEMPGEHIHTGGPR